MSININLVDKKSSEDSRLEKIRQLRGFSFAVLLLTAFLAILIFGVDYRFSASYVRKQQSDLLREISSSSDISAKIFIVNSKLTDLSKILSERKKYGDVTAKIMGNGDSNVAIEEFSYDENGIKMTISSTSLDDIDNFLNSILNLVQKGVLNGIALNSLSFDSGSYVVELSAI